VSRGEVADHAVMRLTAASTANTRRAAGDPIETVNRGIARVLSYRRDPESAAWPSFLNRPTGESSLRRG
jgi:hypothetical protein